MFVTAFLLLALAFVASARRLDDLRYIGNFLLLLLSVCGGSFFGRFAGPRNVAIVATLALAGAGLSLVVALVQVLLLQQSRAMGWGADPI